MKGYSITSQTLVGSSGKYPRQHGNCFSMDVGEEKDCRIVNFLVENLEHLLKKKVITYPIELKLLSPRTAIIIDNRIPESYYQKDYCTICCPKEYWLQEQKDEWQQKIDNGEIIEKDGFVIYKLNPNLKKLKAEWTVEIKDDICLFDKSLFDAPLVYAPYIPVIKKGKENESN
jgi:hypothetical protein